MQAQSRFSVSGGGSGSSVVSAGEYEAVIRELTRGRELTTQLRAEALRALQGQGQAEDTAQVILEKMSSTFTACLSIMGSPTRAPPPPTEPAGAAARRPRDENVPRREMVTYTPYSDGYLWRKYGQKRITNTRFPRCYFRCSYHRDRGCPAAKQVQQRSHGDPPEYVVVYLGEHTCDKQAEREPEAAAASAGATSNPLLDLPGGPPGRQQGSGMLVGAQGEHERQALVESLAIVLGAHSPAGSSSSSSVAFGREPEQQHGVADPSGGVEQPGLDVDAAPLDVMDYDVTGGLYSYGLPDDGLPF